MDAHHRRASVEPAVGRRDAGDPDGGSHVCDEPGFVGRQKPPAYRPVRCGLDGCGIPPCRCSADTDSGLLRNRCCRLWRSPRCGAVCAHKRAAWLIAGGALVGLTGYTYLAARLFPIPIAAALGVLWLQTPRLKRRQLLRPLALILLSALISFAPLGIFFLQNPETFGTRIAQVASPSVTEALQGIWRCLKALVLPGQGDPYIRFNPPGRPILDVPAALLACLGLVVFLRTKYNGAFHARGASSSYRTRGDAAAQRAGDRGDHTQPLADGGRVPIPGSFTGAGAELGWLTGCPESDTTPLPVSAFCWSWVPSQGDLRALGAKQRSVLRGRRRNGPGSAGG